MTNKINRRSFLRQTGFAGASLAIGYYFAGCQGPGEPEPEGVVELFRLNPLDDVPAGAALNPFVIIDPTGRITIMNHKPDMGQGTFQSIPLLVAEELDVALDQVTIKQAPAGKQFGFQGVGGSSTVRTNWEPMRRMGAAAREMLVGAAAARWQVAPEDCYTENGKVVNRASKEGIPYGDLVAEAAQLEVPKEPKLKDPAGWKLIGKSVPRPDIALKVRGAADFGLDIKKEGMVYALIERSPSFSGRIKSLDDSAALAVPGVEKVMKTTRPLGKHNFEGVAVIADSYWAALQGKKALKIEWEEDNKLNTAAIFDNLRRLAAEPGADQHQEGDFAGAFPAATQQLEATYETPFAAHAAMEPMNVLADVRPDGVDIWASTQFPQWAQEETAKLLGIEQDKVTVHVAFLGGGFGRRALSDFVLEGVQLSKELGKPVKVVWTREDDMTQSPFRPASVNVLRGALDENGRLMAFEHKVVAPSIDYSLFGSKENLGKAGEMEPVAEPFYDVPHFRSAYVHADVDPIPLVWWRSVYSSTNVFGQECFIDELAAAAGQDPVAFRLGMLGKNKKYKELLEFLAEKADWNTPLPEGRARGIAITHCFETTAGQVVEVSRGADGRVKIDRVITAVDCGVAVNPNNVVAQCEGCAVMGLSAALKPGIGFENGRAVQTNYHDYQILRINELPPVEVHIKPGTEAPTGVGEPALPPVAPALANALFALTGKRIRKLPIDLGDV